MKNELQRISKRRKETFIKFIEERLNIERRKNLFAIENGDEKKL